MKQTLCGPLALLLALTMTACTGAESASPSPADPTPAPALDPAPTATAEPAPTPTPEPGLDYDEVRPVAVGGSLPSTVGEGFFTVSKDGLWGVAGTDGREYIPCVSEVPVSLCAANRGEWLYSLSDRDVAEKLSAQADAIESATGHAICGGHGVNQDCFIYDVAVESPSDTDLDPAGLKYYGANEGMAAPTSVADEYWAKYGEPLPVYYARMEGEEGDPAYPVADGNGYFYMSRDGRVACPRDGTGAAPTMAQWFFDEALAPVAYGDLWAYCDREGTLCTEAVYEPVYDHDRWAENGNAPLYASPMRNGYAAVCRDGRWGLLDAEGREVIPCTTDGIAWEGTTLWQKDATGWHKTALPG